VRITRPQLRWLWIAASLVAAMCVYPPWNDTSISRYSRRDRPIGYAPIFSPPEPISSYTVVTVDWTRLGLQLFAALALTTVVVLSAAAPKDK
jgi:hypothetical protein